uniref:Uncharacterized protein n=1 Tax=Alexandrium catenella TaxID=2925 RepID=A0A7S1L134_ALECA
MLPLGPWLAWPIGGLYLRDSLVSGVLTLALHVVVLAGLYAVMQFLHQLPPYLDVDYPVLRAHPLLLDLTMRAPPMVPWAAMARTFAGIGAVRSFWKLTKCVLHLRRPAGEGHYVGQLANLEFKVNILLKRSEAMFKQELVSASLGAAEHLEGGDARAAARSLLRLLVLSREHTGDWYIRVSEKLKGRVQGLLDRFQLPPAAACGTRLPPACRAHKLDELAAKGDFEKLLSHAVTLLEKLMAIKVDCRAAEEGERSFQEKTPTPLRRRNTAPESTSPTRASTPLSFADLVTDVSTPQKVSARSPGRSVRESPGLSADEGDSEALDGDEAAEDAEEEATEDVEEEDEEGEGEEGSDACTDEDAEGAEADGQEAGGLSRCAGALAALGGFGAVAAMMAAGAAAGLLPAAGE